MSNESSSNIVFGDRVEELNTKRAAADLDEKERQNRERYAAEESARRRQQEKPEAPDTGTRETDNRGPGLANPIDDKAAKVDLLGRGRLVTILKGIIDRDIKKHMTIALFGQWGSGKSSVIELLRQRYRDDRYCSTILFNAWQNEHSQNMAASIAKSMAEELYQRRSYPAQVWLGIKSHLLERKMATLLYLALASLMLWTSLFGIDIGFFSVDKLSMEKFKSFDRKTMGFSFIATLTALLPFLQKAFNNPFVSKLRELSRRPDFSSHIGLSDNIRRQLGTLIKAYDFRLSHFLLVHPYRWLLAQIGRTQKSSRRPHKFLLAIDDLDRCSSEKIIQVLEAVQLVVDLENLLVILAVDDQVLMEAVANRYQKQRKDLSDADALQLARKYLGKILQVTISLDEPDASARENFICKRLFPAFKSLPGNPLEINAGITREEDDSGLSFLFRPQASLGSYTAEEDEEPSEYLHSSQQELEWFARCVGDFNIHNARTMIRIHNAITLIKGLRPRVTENSQQLQQYIFLTFWLESLCSAEPEQRDYHYRLLTGSDDSLPAFWQKIAVRAQQLGLHKLDSSTRDEMLSHIAGISLPCADILTPHKRQAVEAETADIG
ncbi:P-loop NTPase fold protein [Microbulbifer sp. SAOS-129_SWC]|uniref:KAP family P-loop NTPase fold protein n=1 Tax=Microbulbifer sp. SAOS-129_SWC TaxID=3145235 RepID=UPI0032169F41